MRRGSFALLALLSLSGGCDETIERTQVMVLIDTAPGLRTRIGDVEATVASGARGAEALDEQYSGSLTPGAGVDWPLELAILPRGGNVTREYLVTATALDTTGQPLVTLRVRSGFARGRTLSLVLLFDAACIAEAPDCGAEGSCVEGRCADARVEPEALPDYTLDKHGVPIAQARPPGPAVPAVPQGGADAATDAGPSTSADGGPDATVDAGPPPEPDRCADGTDKCDSEPDACVDEERGFRCECPSTHTGDGIGPDGCRWRPIAMATGDSHTCMQLATGAVKCWGRNREGNLGLGNTERIGDSPNEMGDLLASVALGKGRKVVELVAGGPHNCVRFEDNNVACWGENRDGRLGLGLTDGDNRGDGPGEMGDALPLVDLGSDFTVAQLTASWTHTCARSVEGAIKCWGLNDKGLLGLGDSASRGDSAGEMGDALPVVDLGGMVAKEVVAGAYHNCAKFENDRIKCWGANVFSGEDQARGDQPDELGDQLPFVELGTGLTVVELSTGQYHVCARLSDERIKCWGDNEHGQLGQGDRRYRGHLASEMGDALPAIDLGAQLRVVQLVSGREHNCALFEDGKVKCWGGNTRGQLGLGDIEERGDDPSEMGDALPFVDLGRGVRATWLATQEAHTCALLEDGRVKCWGANDDAQLGLGEADDYRGDQPGEMGDALPAIDLGGL